MIIFLGRGLPRASSDLPGSRNGSDRPVSDSLETRLGSHRFVLSSLFTLLPYLVLLPMGFAEPSRSPGLLVSSYLAVSPLPRPWCKKHRDRGGLFSVALSLSKPLTARLDGGRYPPSRPAESGLSSVAHPSTQAAGPVSRHSSSSQDATAIIAPATRGGHRKPDSVEFRAERVTPGPSLG